MERTLGFKERRYIEELRILTRSTALDCVIDERFDRVIYVIRTGDMGLAIGKKGENIRRLQKVLGRRLEMVEFDEVPFTFLSNIVRPAEIVRLDEDGEGGQVNLLVRRRSDLGIAIGKGGCNVEKARILCKRFFNMDIGEVLLEEDTA